MVESDTTDSPPGGTRLRWTGPPVRPEPRLASSKFVWGFVGLAFGAGLVLAIVGGISQLRLLTESQTTIGVVEAKRFIESRGAGRSYVPPSYQLDYQFVAADEHKYAGRDSVGPDAWRSVAVGNQIPIAYDQRDPGNNQIARSTEQQVWLLTGWALAVMLCAIFVVLATSSLRRTFRRESVARALSSGGTETEAEVTGHRTERFSKSGTLRIIKYRYVDPDGRGHRGEGPYMYPEEADGWPVGSGVRVRYDPARPDDSIWLDDVNWSRSGKGGVRSV